jgi:DNA-binding XRE family transcriptional regulator
MEEDQKVPRPSRWGSGVSSRLESTIERLRELDDKEQLSRSGLPRAPRSKELYDRYDVGYEVHLLRWAAQMSQEEFGHYIGYNKIWVYQLEHNKVNPRINTLKKIGRAFGLQVKVTFELPDDEESLLLPAEFKQRIREVKA